ncbi:RagB/SusD family nutrient uptake outer membrane protein [Chitinophaga sp. Hz27]|uniref:RagB/SusD family nutrient uptake outer membrane protein n=1 Tax=Chitinophaga sp. Hz27 TaxID=3347169 RepID=UPI0035D648DC
MKKLIQLILCGAALTAATSCTKYLDIVPKGQKIPQTLEDYKALLEAGNAHYMDYANQAYVANEWGMLQSSQVNVNLTTINYNWLATNDRLQYLQQDAGYNEAYSSIFVHNVLINHVNEATTGTADQKAVLIAQARLSRALHYFYLVNSYAKTYDASTAATDKGVLINTSDAMEQKLNQSSVKEVYDFIISETNEALKALPETSINALFATKAAGYGLLARVYLFQRDYTKAQEAANNALKSNSQLFDFVQYYMDNKTLADGTSPSITIPKYEFKNPENYVFNYGGSMARLQGFYISFIKAKDSVLYDKGDARLKVNFAARTVSQEVILSYRRLDDVNVGGIRTPEMYYIKAECLARSGDLQGAMDALNTVRRKRIITTLYQDAVATTEAEAIALIRRELRCEYRGTGMIYLDYRRFNVDPVYKTTITKIEGTNTYSIAPDSHLWIMPFSQTAIAYGDGRLTQNSH